MSAVHSGCNRRRRTGCGNAGRGSSGPRQSQALFPVEPVNALAVHRVALPSLEHKEAPVTKPSSLMRQGPEPFAQGSIARPLGLIVHAGSVAAHDAAHAARSSHRLAQTRDGLAVCEGRYHFSKRILQRSIGQHGVGKELLQPRLLAFQRLQPLGLGNLHPSLQNPFGRYGILLSLAAAVLGLPPYKAAALIPCLRHSSATETPASLSSKIPIIRSSTNLLRFIVRSFLRSGFYDVLDEIQGARQTIRTLNTIYR